MNPPRMPGKYFPGKLRLNSLYKSLNLLDKFKRMKVKTKNKKISLSRKIFIQVSKASRYKMVGSSLSYFVKKMDSLDRLAVIRRSALFSKQIRKCKPTYGKRRRTSARQLHAHTRPFFHIRREVSWQAISNMRLKNRRLHDRKRNQTAS